MRWPSRRAMSRPVPSLPVAGTDRPPVATITRSRGDRPAKSRRVKPAASMRDVGDGRVEPDLDTLDRANATSASRTSFALFDRGNSLPDSSSSASGICRSSSKKARCSCSGHGAQHAAQQVGRRVGDESIGRQHRGQHVASAAAADQDLAAAVLRAFDQRRRARRVRRGECGGDQPGGAGANHGHRRRRHLHQGR